MSDQKEQQAPKNVKFDVIESNTPKEIISTLAQYDTTGSMGPNPFLSMLFEFESAIFSVIIALALTFSFFFTAAGTTLPVILENAIIPIIIVISAVVSLISTVLVHKGLDLESMMPAVGRANAIGSFFAQGLFDPDKAKDARMSQLGMYEEALVGERRLASMQALSKKIDGANLKISLSACFSELVLMLVIYLLVAFKTWQGTISYGEALLYASSFFMLSQALTQCFTALPMLLNNRDYFTRVNTYLTLPEGSRTCTTERELGCEDVTFAYPGSENPVLDHVSMSIAQGEKVALVGENGSGKTTLVKLLSGFYEPQSGVVHAPTSLSAVFQDFSLLQGRLLDVLASSSDDDAKDSDAKKQERLTELLAQVNLTQRIEKTPKGLQSFYGSELYPDKGIDFSGGEKQKLAIVRALYEPHDFLIMDEPTAALDPIAEAELYQLLSEIVGKRGLLLISHRLSSCTYCDRICVLKDGKIVEEGSHKALLAQNGYYKTLWDAQAQMYKSEERVSEV